MSLRPEPIGPVPEETSRVAHAVFRRGNVYLKLRDELGTLYEDEAFVSLFPTRGQPAEAPWRLALVTVLQFAEGLSDRQAAEAVRSRIDWKYFLGLEIEDPGFDYSILSEFRTRLIAGRAERVLLDSLLEQQGQIRLDGASVLGKEAKVRGRQGRQARAIAVVAHLSAPGCLLSSLIDAGLMKTSMRSPVNRVLVEHDHGVAAWRRLLRLHE